MLKLSACANTWNINYSSHTHFWSKPIRQYQTSFPSQYETSKTRLGGSSWMKQESMVQHGAADPAFSTRHSLHWGETYHEMLARSYLIIHLRLLVSSFYCTMAIVASYLSIVMQNMMIFSITIAGWWFFVLPLWKMTDWKSVGMMKFPI